MNTIVIKDLTKRYGDLIAVDALNLEIKKGEIFGLLGPNGAGKTTTLMMLSTLIQPTSGIATVNGFDVVKEPAKVRQSIGMIFQDPSSDDTLTGYENLKLHALMYDVPFRKIDEKIDAVLSIVELKDRKNDIVKKYSGGMRRRLEIARGLIHEPEVLFLDEPTIGLDPQTRGYIWNYITSLAERMHMTIILTTHYMEEAEKLCDRIAIMDGGKIVALDTPENLKRSLGGDMVMVKGAHAKPDDFLRLPFVKKVEERDGALVISVENSGKHLQELLRVAGTVDYVEVHAPDMNDVFLSMTGHSIREEEGGTMERLRSYTKARNR